MDIRRALGWGATLALVGWWLASKRATTYRQLHPELRAPALRLRSPNFTPKLVSAMQRMPHRAPAPTDVQFEARTIPGPSGAPPVTVYLYRPLEGQQNTGALLFIHGGGYMFGSAQDSHPQCSRFARELSVLVVNIEYRLAPQTPFPGPLKDCFAALKWMADHADDLGIDSDQIAVAGDSAGGGLAAALSQLAHDRGEVEPCFQLLVYPMLDDRTVLQADHRGRGEFVWTPPSNRLEWTSYLCHPPRLESAPEYAVPARRQNLKGLAPAWIGVGTLDLFYPEDLAYARRLQAAGVSCEFFEVKGAYHASETVAAGASISGEFLERGLQALKRGLRLA